MAILGWLGKLLGVVPKEEMEGIRLNTTEPYWEVDGPRTFEELLNALISSAPENAVLYLEGGSPDAEIGGFLAARSVPEVSHVAIGTIWPRPQVFHVPATSEALGELARIMGHHAEPELAVHFHVYRDDDVLLEWHDAFSQPMLVSGAIPEEKVKALADKLGTAYRAAPG